MTNIERIKMFSSDEMAFFLVTIVRKICSLNGIEEPEGVDEVSHIVEWLDAEDTSVADLAEHT